MSASPCTIVIATHERVATLLVTLDHLTRLPERPPIIVVDNGSQDGTADRIVRGYPEVRVMRLTENIGAAARTLGVRVATTPFVAFCDDDCWWEPGALERAAPLLETHPEVAVLNARVLVGIEERVDPACTLMARGDVRRRGTGPGTPIGYFMAGAAIVRRDAFLAVGGYHERYHIGAEESLLALDLLAAGWQLCYVDDVVLHHYPAAAGRDSQARRRLVLRNRLWTAWLRHSRLRALRATLLVARSAIRDRTARAALYDALCGLRWVVRERRPVAREIEAQLAALIELPA